jgi:hypothetical protein
MTDTAQGSVDLAIGQHDRRAQVGTNPQALCGGQFLCFRQCCCVRNHRREPSIDHTLTVGTLERHRLPYLQLRRLARIHIDMPKDAVPVTKLRDECDV